MLLEVIATSAFIPLSVVQPSHVGLDKIGHLFLDQGVSFPMTPLFSQQWLFESSRKHHSLLPSMDVELAGVFSKNTASPGSYPYLLVPCAEIPKFSAQL